VNQLRTMMVVLELVLSLVGKMKCTALEEWIQPQVVLCLTFAFQVKMALKTIGVILVGTLVQ